MKNRIVLAITFCLVLTACGQKSTLQQIVASASPEPTSTLISTSSPTPVPFTPTVTPFPPFQHKNILFEYYAEGGFTAFDVFYDPNTSLVFPRLVLYEDGLLILPGQTFQQKILSRAEIQEFQSRLDALGFNSLESNQKTDATDKLYVDGYTGPSVTDGQGICVTSKINNPKKLCAYEPDLQFVVPQMKAILQFLDAYRPEGLTPYYPDRLLVSVEEGRFQYDDNPPQAAIPWDARFPSLVTSQPVFFVEGEMAKDIYSLFEDVQMSQIFTQNGKEFTVRIQVVLPHEVLTYNP